MKKEPLVSIIVPIYNVEKYIVKGVESLCNQNYNNIEVLYGRLCAEEHTVR